MLVEIYLLLSKSELHHHTAQMESGSDYMQFFVQISSLLFLYYSNKIEKNLYNLVLYFVSNKIFSTDESIVYLSKDYNFDL